MSDNISSAPVAESSPSSDVSSEGQETSVESNSDESTEVQASVPEVKKELPRTKRLKLKVDGEELEEEVNFDDDEYLTKQIQMARVAQKRMQETAQLRKQMQGIEQYLSQAKGDPKRLRALLRDLGADEKALAAQIIEDEITNSQKSPEQIEKEKLQEELQRLKDEAQRKEEEFKSKEFERLQAQEYERYDMQISKALEKSDLPKQPYVIKKMADYMLTALQHGVELTPDEILPLVKDEIVDDLKQMFSVASDDVIEALVGKDTISRLRKKSVAAAKAKPPQPLKSSIKDTGKVNSKEEKPKDKQSFRTFFGV